MGKNAWNMLINHVFVDQFSENFSVVYIYATNILFICGDLVQEIARYKEYYTYKEYN